MSDRKRSGWRGIAISVALFLIAGCSPVPDSYPPPIQRKALSEGEERPSGMLVRMSDADAESYFVRDISPTLEGGRWRWTFERPELRLFLSKNQAVRAVWEFGIAPVTFERTGPVTISFWVNGKPVGRFACARPGDYTAEFPVPRNALKVNGYNLISAQADRYFVAETDGAKLGFTLIRAGFIE